ncbi:MAG: response regulator [Deltaproteobacteria bacterium]|nr:MAG: response regulator [Deltaproteobacteria bacterium]
MTRLRALVLEDEWPARNYLVQLIEETRLAEVVGAVACVGEAREALAGLPVDVVFVDVQLCGGESGLDLVESAVASHSEGARPAGPGPLRVVARRKRNLVFLDPAEIWAFEASDRLSFVHSRQGKFDIDLSLAAIETSFGRSLLRVHRNWLVNLDFARILEREDGETSLFVGPSLDDESQGVRIPVSRDRAPALRAALLANATGLRQT